MRVAVVHDWLYTIGGAERVLSAILKCFPQADLFCLFDLLNEDGRKLIGYSKSKTSFIQRLPGLSKHHRSYLPLMPLAIEQLDLRAYDLILSSSYAVAKGVITGPDQLHISYLHSPMRYAWDLQHQYLEESGLETGLKSWIARVLLHQMRMWDVRTANAVDHYVANSYFIARRIRKLYGRKAAVIYPPVRVPASLPNVTKESFFLTASRLVPYKNVHAIVQAFRDLPEQELLVVGDGPEFARIQKTAGSNVRLLGRVDDATLSDLMARASAFVFAAEEDFGIVPVEAQGQGTPVIALGRGGACETVVTEGARPTGLFFSASAPEQISLAVRSFLAAPQRFSPANCHMNAMRFSEERFISELRVFVSRAQEAFTSECRRSRQPGFSLDETELAAAE